jgi:hypothetical protein
MRVYGRVVPDPLYPYTRKWIEVDTDSEGHNDMVYLTNLIQVIRLNLGESPFFANWGIPAHPSVVTQIAPDYYMTLTQQRFAPYFLSLLITRSEGFDEDGVPSPQYNVNAITTYGAYLSEKISY